MFRDWFSGELRVWYLRSRHKDRVDHVGSCLQKRQYAPQVVRQKLHDWGRFVRHLEKKSIPLPSSVFDNQVQRYLEEHFSARPSNRRGTVRATIRIFLEMDGDGKFARRVQSPRRTTNSLYAEVVPRYLTFLRKHQGISKKTIGTYDYRLTLFTGYLKRIGTMSWKDVQVSALRTFLTTELPGRKPVTRLSYASTFRTFYRWAYLQGIVERDLSTAIAAVRQYRLAGIPDILTDAELSALLQSADRMTAVGKRDYAIVLLAARYGMRSGDIRQLTLDHIQWRHRQIALQQSKTGRLLLLPLLQDVSDALIDYLRNGRPQTEFRNIFVRHRAPYEPFCPGNNLPTIFQRVLRQAGLDGRNGRKGLRLLRHTLATRMLSAGCAMKTIGDVLGHVSLDSTLVYTKVDLSHLKTVALSMEDLLR
jgi:site-specific recombinase XerD